MMITQIILKDIPELKTILWHLVPTEDFSGHIENSFFKQNVTNLVYADFQVIFESTCYTEKRVRMAR